MKATWFSILTLSCFLGTSFMGSLVISFLLMFLLTGVYSRPSLFILTYCLSCAPNISILLTNFPRHMFRSSTLTLNSLFSDCNVRISALYVSVTMSCSAACLSISAARISSFSINSLFSFSEYLRSFLVLEYLGLRILKASNSSSKAEFSSA